MNKLFIDLATNSGYAGFHNGKLISHWSHKLQGKTLLEKADNLRAYLREIKGDYQEFYIEKRNANTSFKTNQVLDVLHFVVLEELRDERMFYISQWWTKHLENKYRMSRTDLKKDGSFKVATGKEKKQLVIECANDLFNLELKFKDNDIADAIVMGYLEHKGLIHGD